MNNLQYADMLMSKYTDVSEDVKQSTRDSLKHWLYEDYPVDHELLKKIIISDMENA